MSVSVDDPDRSFIQTADFCAVKRKTLNKCHCSIAPSLNILYILGAKLTSINNFPYIIIKTIYLVKINQFLEMQKEQNLSSLDASKVKLSSIIHEFQIEASSSDNYAAVLTSGIKPAGICSDVQQQKDLQQWESTEKNIKFLITCVIKRSSQCSFKYLRRKNLCQV